MDRVYESIVWQPIQAPTQRLCSCISERENFCFGVARLAVWNGQLYLHIAGCCNSLAYHILVFEDGLLGHKWSYVPNETGFAAMSLEQKHNITKDLNLHFQFASHWKDDSNAKLILNWKSRGENADILALAEPWLACFNVLIRTIFIASSYYGVVFSCTLPKLDLSYMSVSFLLDTGNKIHPMNLRHVFACSETTVSLRVSWDYIDLECGCNRLVVWLKKLNADNSLFPTLSNCNLQILPYPVFQEKILGGKRAREFIE